MESDKDFKVLLIPNYKENHSELNCDHINGAILLNISQFIKTYPKPQYILY